MTKTASRFVNLCEWFLVVVSLLFMWFGSWRYVVVVTASICVLSVVVCFGYVQI